MRMRIEPRIAGLYRLYRQLAAHLFPITPHITDAFHRMLAGSKDAMKVYTDEQADKGEKKDIAADKARLRDEGSAL
jgi:hypothetical protein